MKMPATLRRSAAIIAVGMALAAQEAWPADSGGQVESAAPDQNTTGQNTTEQSSPWLAMPTVSSDTKLGAYLHYFDEKSQASMFGAPAQYTSTDSKVGGVFAKTSLV